MKKSIPLLLCLLLSDNIRAAPFRLNASAYDKTKQSELSRKYKILLGMDAGVSIAYTNLSFASNVYGKIAYQYKNISSLGVTFGVSHLKDTFSENLNPNLNNPTRYTYNNLVYSAGIFYRISVLKYLLFNVEPRLYYSKKVLSIKQPYSYHFSENAERKLIGGMILGAGISHNTFLNIISSFYVNYDLIQNRYSPYYNRIDLRFGFMLPL